MFACKIIYLYLMLAQQWYETIFHIILLITDKFLNTNCLLKWTFLLYSRGYSDYQSTLNDNKTDHIEILLMRQKTSLLIHGL